VKTDATPAYRVPRGHARSIDIVESECDDGPLRSPDSRSPPVAPRAPLSPHRCCEDRGAPTPPPVRDTDHHRKSGIPGRSATVKIIPTARWRAKNAVCCTAVAALAIDDHRGGVHESRDAGFSRNPERHRRSVIVVQRVLVDVADVGPKPDLGSQMNNGVAAGCRRCEPIMIGDVIPPVEDAIEDTDLVPGRCELIMSCSADETGTAGEQHLHMERLAGGGTGKATSKRQPPSTLRTEISPPCDSTMLRAIARPRPAHRRRRCVRACLATRRRNP
jgi:hypothetical protein